MSREKIDKKTWISLRADLNNSYDFNNKWGKVINLFKQRIEDFYFTPIKAILKPNDRKGEGFAIVTLQCVLIEMFAAFRFGKIYIRDEKKRFNYQYKETPQYFIKFLHTEDIFENHFFIANKKKGGKILNQPYDAKEFYDRVRCGLMHEARTKMDWRITAKAEKNVSGKIFIQEDKDHIKNIQRTTLHNILKDYFENKFLLELKEENANGNKLRRFLARKLDHLHDIPEDTKYDWIKED